MASPKQTRRKQRIPKCEDCFFQENLLCALNLSEPCPTFRPGGPDGLKPPRQLSFVFRHEPPTRALVPFRAPSY